MRALPELKNTVRLSPLILIFPAFVGGGGSDFACSTTATSLLAFTPIVDCYIFSSSTLCLLFGETEMWR
jgi:hypothetical protein